MTHAMNEDDEARRKVALIDRFRVAQYAYLVQKLGEIPEGEGTLLDRCVLTLGAGLGNGNLHNYDHLATVTAGRGIGPHAPVPMRTGRHVRCPKGRRWRTCGCRCWRATDSTASASPTARPRWTWAEAAALLPVVELAAFRIGEFSGCDHHAVVDDADE